MALLTIIWSCTSFFFLFLSVTARNASDCSCGYYDSARNHLYTDSIIVYLNETEVLSPEHFVKEDFENKYEKSWNGVYRAGAAPANLGNATDGNVTSLQLAIDPPTKEHLVVGAGIRTARRDIQYGLFCALMRSPPPNSGGSSLTMLLEYNDTQSMALNVQNTDKSSTAWISNIVNHEFPSRDLGINYTVVEAGSKASGNEVSPWDFIEYCIDWSKDDLDFYVAGNRTRSFKKKNAVPSVPAPLIFKHFSTGDPFSMQGPPTKRSTADIAWIRMFFNSTTTNQDDAKGFASKCSVSDACAISDMELRGSTTYSHDALQKWKQSKHLTGTKIAAIILSILSIGFTTLLLFHAFLRRAPWRKYTRPQPKKEESHNKSAPASLAPSTRASSIPDGHALQWKPSEATLRGQQSHPTLRPMRSEATLVPSAGSSRCASMNGQSMAPPVPKLPWDEKSPESRSNSLEISCKGDNDERNFKNGLTVEMASIPRRPILTPAVSVTATGATKPPPKKRIDYLAGLVAFASLLVTAIHFGLTFVPAATSPGGPVHYSSEVIAERTVTQLFLTFSWVGVFFTTSTRFLVSNYLKNGDLLNVAEKAVGRAPRLLIPVVAVALLEYFVMNCGATSWLEYLPSITWSTWPYTTLYASFGDFLSEILELLYLIPNAAPQITFNYCTGVLWTIPVQLQGSWLVLLGAVVVKEIRTPWKRIAYYSFCIIVHWYARSWGSFLWLGLLITDLDVSYNYKTWLYARPAVYYPVLLGCFLISAVGFAPDIVAQWRPFNLAIRENDIHPDMESGLPLGQTPNGGYPAYYIPRFGALMFVAGFQMLVELSTNIQKALSFPLLMKLFPHILTIYLTHGLVFWSLGSWICVHLAAIGVPYWANLCVIAVCCYATIFMSLPILTPVIETLGRHITGQIWEFASQGGAPRRKTLFPFPDDLFLKPENFKHPHDDRGGNNGSDLENCNRKTFGYDTESEKSPMSSQGPFSDKYSAGTTNRNPFTDDDNPSVREISLKSPTVVIEESYHVMNFPSRDSSDNDTKDHSVQGDIDAQQSSWEHEGLDRSRKESTGQPRSSIGSNNPWRNSVSHENAQVGEDQHEDTRESGLSTQGNRYLPEIDGIGEETLMSSNTNPFNNENHRNHSGSANTKYSREETSRQRSTTVTSTISRLRSEVARQRSASDASSISETREETNGQRAESALSLRYPSPGPDFGPSVSSPASNQFARTQRRPTDAHSLPPNNPPPPRPKAGQNRMLFEETELRDLSPVSREPPLSSLNPRRVQPGQGLGTGVDVSPAGSVSRTETPNHMGRPPTPEQMRRGPKFYGWEGSAF